MPTINPIYAAVIDGQRTQKTPFRQAWSNFAYSLDSVAALRDHDGRGQKLVFVGGSIFKYDANDTTTADDGVNCVHDNTGKRYKLVQISTTGITQQQLDAAILAHSSATNPHTQYQLKTSTLTPLPKPPGFAFVPGRIYDAKPGNVTHNIDIQTEFARAYGTLGGGDLEFDADSVYISPTGNDTTGTGASDAPYASLNKAYRHVAAGTILVMPGTYTERFDIRASHNLVGGTVARAIRVRALAGPGSVTFRTGGQQPSALTFTTVANGWEATLATTEQPEWVIYKPNGSTKEVVLPFVTNLATVKVGWTFDDATDKLTIRFGNVNVQTSRDQFEIIHRPSLGQPLLYGTTTYFEDIIWRGPSLLLQFEPSNPTCRPVGFFKRCEFHYNCGHGIYTEGALLMTQDCLFNYTVFDGINYNETPSGTYYISEGLEINFHSLPTIGHPFCRYNVTTSNAQNRQPSSAHKKCIVARLGGVYDGYWGQSIADTGIGADASSSWNLGLTGSPALNKGTGFAPALTRDAVIIEGKAWFHGCVMGGPAARYGLAIFGDVKVYQSDFSGGLADYFGTPVVYDPANP